MKLTVARILSYPINLFKAPTCKSSSVQRLNPSEPQDKPVKVTVVPTSGTKAAMVRDWVIAMFFGLFAGITVHDKFLKPKNTNNVDALIKSLDLNGDSHISKEELETVKELLRIIEKSKEKK